MADVKQSGAVLVIKPDVKLGDNTDTVTGEFGPLSLVNSARNSGDFGPEHNGHSDFGPNDCVPSTCGLIRARKCRYPSECCQEECVWDVIEYSGCECWTHASCIPIGQDMLRNWCGADKDFLCKSCAFTGGSNDMVKTAKLNFADKLYLAPLTTVGNLPFRRLCKTYGADITCSEMAMSVPLLKGQQSEWAILRRHESEDMFGVQLCGSYTDTMTRCAQLLQENIEMDFVDINCGCPLDLVFKKGDGCALMGRTGRFEKLVRCMTEVLDVPLTVKMRTGIYESKSIAHNLTPRLRDWGVSLVTLHGRSREQRYTRLADWTYIDRCAQVAAPMPVFGNGDILSYEDANLRRKETSVAGMMIGRGALIKPWIFTEIKEQRHWDISSCERLDMLRNFTNYGLEQWGSDQRGVATTRRFLLEWLSFLYRYIPVGVLERLPQRINEKPPYYVGRNDLETLMASGNCADWVKISELLLGPVPGDFEFLPKHKANAYQ
ncbi:tRNA-dihydrouridine(47) synthase [NAD(P)(+)]-like [Lamellibrachia satsuma]|nr:tRNA-dihydrouridine(47) synthase [NAD(P)(+)]-like [Lamellibrachia satsuma]